MSKVTSTPSGKLEAMECCPCEAVLGFILIAACLAAAGWSVVWVLRSSAAVLATVVS